MPREDVHVIFDAADSNRRAFELFADAADVSVQLSAPSGIAKEWTTLFR
jgi:hypothetical protein